MLSALAACTRTVEIGNLVLGMGFPHPGAAGKDGRHRGQDQRRAPDPRGRHGIPREGVQRLRLSYDHRYSRFEEAIQIRLRTPEDRRGRFRWPLLPGARVSAQAARTPSRGPAIMFGTRSPKMLRLTARYADMWNVYWTSTNTDRGRAALRDVSTRPAPRSDGTRRRWSGRSRCWSRNRMPTVVEQAADRSQLQAPRAVDRRSGRDSPRAERISGRGHLHVQVSLDGISTAVIERFAPVSS